MEKKIRYGIIGCGEHALRAHAVPALGIPELELVALCDPSETQMDSFARSLGQKMHGFTAVLDGALARFTDAGEFMKGGGVDAVVIASPDRFHTETLLRAASNGKHVLCEKPLAVELKDFFVLRGALIVAEKTGVVVTSCHPRRFDPPFLWVREALPGLREELGEIVALDFDFSYHAPSGKKGDLHVGLLMDHLNHEFDLMTFLCGFSHVRAHKLADDQLRYHVAGVREDGVTFSFRGTRMLKAGRYPEYLRIRFARGELDLNCENGEVRVARHETGRVDTPRIAATDYKARFASVMRNFADAILDRSSNYLSPYDLLRNSEIGIALTMCKTWNSHDYG